MGGIICLAGQTCCSCFFNSCSSSLDSNKQQTTKLGYISIFTVSLIFGLIFYYFGDDALSILGWIGIDQMTGQQAIYHESFSLMLFYALMLLFTSFGGSFSTIINRDIY